MRSARALTGVPGPRVKALSRIDDTTVVPIDWGFEEIVIVCDVVAENGWKGLNHGDTRVPVLSGLLRSMSPEHAAQDPKFRNEHGVTRKAGDCQTAHPDYLGGRTRGGQTTQTVVDAFVADPASMHELALAIRAVAEDAGNTAPSSTIKEDDSGVDEGGVFERRVLVRERDQGVRRDKVSAVRKALGAVCCEVCAFDFESVYGHRGRDFCEVHHRNPLSVAGPSKTKLTDLAVLCSNCHRMLHRRRPWLTVEQLAELVGSH